MRPVGGAHGRLEAEPMKPPLRVSVLDQSPISEGSSGPDALRNTVDLARLADELGFERYWLAEHHATPMLACASPEVVIAAVAAETSRLRVGSGGVMLPHYSPLKVAETFSVLSGLYPRRIDLGIGRAPGTDSRTMFALQRDRRFAAPDDFPDQLMELLAYLEDTFPAGHPFARLAALPGRPEAPEVWLLGSSLQSAIWAGQLGLPYAFADFISPEGADKAHTYRQQYAPSQRAPAPCVSVAVSAICAESDAEASRLAASLQMVITLLHQGQLIEVPPVEKAERWLAAHGLQNAMPPGRRAVIGSPETVRAGLEEVVREYGAEELMIVTITHEHAARRRSYELIAEAFGLAPATSAGLAAAPAR
jgi:luciferase family oxidoreductase group 1